MELELELQKGGWTARVRGTESEVRVGAKKLASLLDEVFTGDSLEPSDKDRAPVELLPMTAWNASSLTLSQTTLLTLYTYENRPLTKEELASKLRQLGRPFGQTTLENKSIPFMVREGLLHFNEKKVEGSRGQAPREYFLTERGKLEAEETARGLASRTPNDSKVRR